MLGTRTCGAWHVGILVWSHHMANVPALDAWMACAKREISWMIVLVCAGNVAIEDVGSFRGYVTSRPNKDEFEPTSGPSVGGVACVWGVVLPCKLRVSLTNI